MEHGLHLSRGHWASQGWLKDTPASAGDAGDASSIPGLGRPPGGGNGNPLQCSWLENLTDRGAWRATAHGVTKTRTQLKRLSTHTEMSLKLKKEPHRSCKALLAVWAGAQPGVSPAPGATQRPAPGPDRDEAGRAALAEGRAEPTCSLCRPGGGRPQTQAAVQGVLPCGGPDLKQPAQENNSIALRLNFPPKS